MRHDPAGAAIVIMSRSLKMPGMAQAVGDLLECESACKIDPLGWVMSE